MRHSLRCRASVLAILTAAAPMAVDAQTASPLCTPSATVTCKPDETNSEPPTSSGAASDVAVNADGSTRANERGTDDVVVTGSRIRRPNVSSTTPITITGREYLEERGFTNVADAINTQPGVRGSITPNGAQGSFGQGVNFINNFNLGSNRTLTLVNGRRFVTSNPNTLFNQGSAGSQVDVNAIQSILLDHAENVSISGATVYGSDAIGATVNYILRDRYKGLTVTGLSGINEAGDGFRYNVAALAGHDFLDGRLNITAAYTHDSQKGFLYSDRDFLRAGVGSVTNPTSAQAAAFGRTAAGITSLNDGRINTGFGYNDSATDGFPGSLVVRDRTLYTLTTGGVVTDASRGATFTTANRVAAAVNNYQFDASGNLVPFNKGIVFASPYASGGDGYRLFPYSQVTSDLRRDTADLFLHYDAADALKFYFEGKYFRSRGDQLVRQPTYNASLFGGTSAQLTFLSTNPFLSAQAKAQLAALGVTRFQLSRASDDLADTSGRSDTNLARAVFGAKGDFKVGGHSFYYDAYANYGRTQVDDYGQDLNAQHFINAVNVTTNAAGQIVCNPTPTVQAAPGGTAMADPGCVPLNLFGTGAPSAAARAYIIQNTHTVSLLQQKDFVANVGGSPFTLFGNDYGFNIGYEHREEDGKFTPDAFQQAGLGRSVAIAPTRGSYNVDELFGEVSLPIVQPSNGLRYLNVLEIESSARYVDNTVNGGFFAWSAGGRIGFIPDLIFRGDYTKSFRGPAITELFLPRSTSFVTVPDLCAPGAIGAGSAPAIRTRNCTAFLAAYPNATPLDAANATVPGINGGNPTLQNEVSRSYSFGGVFQPRWIPGLTVTVDYVDIRIANPITSLTVAQIASACFDNTTFDVTNPANGNQFCSQLRRYATGQGGTAANGGDRGGQIIVDQANPGVSSGYVNGNRIYFSGIQSKITYSVRMDGLHLPGRFTTDNTIFYVNRRLVDTTGVVPQRTDGIFGDPKFQFQSNNSLSIDRVGGISASANYVGKQIATRTALSTDLREFNRLNPYVTVDGSVWLSVDDKFRLTFAVLNIGNKQYQNYLGFANPNSYIDLYGRRFSVTATAKF